MMDTVLQAFMIILEPSRLAILFVGVILGLIVGVIPGLSGVVGLAILIPFTYGLDPYAAFALLIGMHARDHEFGPDTGYPLRCAGDRWSGSDGRRWPCDG